MNKLIRCNLMRLWHQNSNKCCLLPIASNNNQQRFKYSTINGKYIHLVEDGIKQIRIYEDLQLEPAELDWKYYLNKDNMDKIQDNINKRNGTGNLKRIHELYQQFVEFIRSLEDKNENISDNEFTSRIMLEKLYRHVVGLPNDTHPDVPIGDESNADCIQLVGIKNDRNKQSVDEIAKSLGWLKDDNLSLYSTQRAYILKNDLAYLENALVNYAIDYLIKNDFTLVTVPDILHHGIIESCGFPTTGERSQVYKVDYTNDYGKYCLSGTSEMALAGFLKDRVIETEDLPLKLCAASRCFRAEVSGSEKEGRLYRLHEFTKVEMFVVTFGDTKISNLMLDELKEHQINLFSNLGLHFRVLDMPTQELGSPAYRKYDIEAWMPATNRYGEISSTSNCTDYQSRRLHIKSIDHNYTRRFAHTLNGTACAIPRLLTCIVENNWDSDKKVVYVPKALQPYVGKAELKAPKIIRKADHFKGSK